MPSTLHLPCGKPNAQTKGHALAVCRKLPAPAEDVPGVSDRLPAREALRETNAETKLRSRDCRWPRDSCPGDEPSSIGSPHACDAERNLPTTSNQSIRRI